MVYVTLFEKYVRHNAASVHRIDFSLIDMTYISIACMHAIGTLSLSLSHTLSLSYSQKRNTLLSCSATTLGQPMQEMHLDRHQEQNPMPSIVASIPAPSAPPAEPSAAHSSSSRDDDNAREGLDSSRGEGSRPRHRAQTRGPRQRGEMPLSEDWLIPYRSLSDLQLIGSGSFSNVYKAKWETASVAVKVFKRTANRAHPSIRGQASSLTQSLAPDGIREVQLLLRLRHPNIVSFIGVVDDPVSIVMELMPRGSLLEAIASSGGGGTGGLECGELTWARRLQIARDVAAGMAYLHSKSILHRDLKSPNVFLDDNWTAKVRPLAHP